METYPGTLVANTPTEKTSNTVGLTAVEIVNIDGSDLIWYRVDGITAVPWAEGVEVLPATICAQRVRLPKHAPPHVVSLYSEGTPQFTVRFI